LSAAGSISDAEGVGLGGAAAQHPDRQCDDTGGEGQRHDEQRAADHDESQADIEQGTLDGARGCGVVHLRSPWLRAQLPPVL
jgi:hypothetical protein